ncbi:hypothetical protein SKTS_13570 [Sulfurimicrobium lacus]|uniref:Mu-like prophage FluMu N-terminal domain-containing protein n=1 Tax=Sulfurimicrobium lacus TaxID=2715678 RepID=A0A6F8VBE8_9PROT|nr:HI1506-related protein [Sulfurimicrobium lacus]BCB26471.1 hypothetical protein SKTS_13570 [Sulfurimicrobium lacus]
MAKTTPRAAAKTGSAKPAGNAGATEQENAGAGADNQEQGNGAGATTGSASAGTSEPGEDSHSGQAAEPVAMLRVAARVNGFRRCGRAWPSAAVTVPASDFSGEQIDILKRDPELVVTEVAE